MMTKLPQGLPLPAHLPATLSFRLFAAAVLVIHLSMRETFVMTLKIKQQNNGIGPPMNLPEAGQPER